MLALLLVRRAPNLPLRFASMSTGSRLADGIDEMNDEIRQHFLIEGDTEPSHDHALAEEKISPILPLSHVDASGKAKMVDVSAKAPTTRSATASAWIAIEQNRSLSAEESVSAQLAGIRAAKLTSLMIPLCHPINLSSVDIDLSPPIKELSHQRLLVSATATSSGQTGVEMEAMAAATFASLHLLLSALGSIRGSSIRGVMLESKTGGKSGFYSRDRSEYDPSPSTLHAASLSHQQTLSNSAIAQMTLPAESWRGLIENVNKKGDVLKVSRVAGLLAAQQDSFLLPIHSQPSPATASLSHPIDLSLIPQLQPSCSLSDGGRLLITSSSSTAPSRALLVAVLVASLTVYDMCKAASKDIQIDEIKFI